MNIKEAIEALSPPYTNPLDEDGAMVGVSRQALYEVLEYVATLQKLDEVRLCMADEVCLALDIALQYAGIEGAHHKAWVIDQMVRALTGANYASWAADARAGKEGPGTYTWEVGIPP